METVIILGCVIAFLCLVIVLQMWAAETQRKFYATRESDLLEYLCAAYTPAAFQIRHGATIETMQAVQVRTAAHAAATGSQQPVNEEIVGDQVG